MVRAWVSPVWYDLLYMEPTTAGERYLTLIARQLRELGAAASTAQIVDAVELTDSLRALRGLALAGLDEMKEAALGALSQGQHLLLDEALSLVESGRVVGQVPESTRSLPLQIDLEARLKDLRLLSIYGDMAPVERELDLRKPKHLATSQLLVQLQLLDIDFGQRRVDPSRAQGTFRELWTLHWRPEYTLSLVVAHPSRAPNRSRRRRCLVPKAQCAD